MTPSAGNWKIILGSNSPRRKELLAGTGIPFEVRPAPDADESYPAGLQAEEIPLYIARKKAGIYLPSLSGDELLITADTIVWFNHSVLGKPVGRADAIRMLQALSAHTHEVITGVCLTTRRKSKVFAVTSTVKFAAIEEKDIEYYVDNCRPYDKAGAYGIQEWIGYIAVEGIEGSFYNVMGLPIQRVYKELRPYINASPAK